MYIYIYLSMPNYSKIANRTVTSVSIDRDKLAECRKRGINVSLFLDEALSREFNPDEKEAFTKAVTNQNRNLKNFIKDSNLNRQYDDFKYGDQIKHVVLEKEENPRETRQSQRDIEGL